MADLPRTPRRSLSPSERAQRSALVAQLYKAGCTTREICIYLGISHGACILMLEAEGVPRRPRGRPRFDAPLPPRPYEVMGEDYVPPYLTALEIEHFEYRVQHLMGEVRTRPGATRVSEEYDLPQTVYREMEGSIALTLAEELPDELEVPERALPEMPSSVIADRLTSIQPEGLLDLESGMELLEDVEVAAAEDKLDAEADEDSGEEDDELIAF